MNNMLRNHRKGGVVHAVVALYTAACGASILVLSSPRREGDDGPTDDQVTCFWCIAGARRDGT